MDSRTMNYKLTHSDMIIRLDDDSWIPMDPGNVDYQGYLEWISQGNVPIPADPISQPEELTAQQKLEMVGLSIEDLKTLLGI